MRTEKLTFSIRVNLGNYGENLSISETVYVPSNNQDDNQRESDSVYDQLVETCLQKAKRTVKKLGRENEAVLLRGIEIASSPQASNNFLEFNSDVSDSNNFDQQLPRLQTTLPPQPNNIAPNPNPSGWTLANQSDDDALRVINNFPDISNFQTTQATQPTDFLSEMLFDKPMDVFDSSILDMVIPND